MARIIREMTCPKCDNIWEAQLTVDYGVESFTRDNDAFCNECGSEGIPGEEVLRAG